MNKYLLAAMLGSTLLAGPSYAQTAGTPAPAPAPYGEPGQGRGHGGGMMRADTNQDGVVSRDEAIAQADKQFARLDANGDGMISKAEMDDARDAMAALGGGHMPPPPPPGTDGQTPPAPGAAPAPGGHKGMHGMRGMGGGRMGERMLERMDTNGDGNISREEYRAAALTRFDRMDSNHDGRVDQSEMNLAREMMMQRRGAGGPGGDMPPGDGSGQ